MLTFVLASQPLSGSFERDCLGRGAGLRHPLIRGMSSGLCAQAAALIAKYAVYNENGRPRLQPDTIAVDPCNRDGIFATPDDIQDLGAAILGVGFSDQMTRGICVQLRPCDKPIVVAYNREKTQVSQHFPKVDENLVEYSAIAGNTLNLFLRSVRQGVHVMQNKPGLDAVSDDGRLSVDLLRKVDGVFASAASTGVMWLVLSSRIRDEEPGGLQIIQAAENVFGSIQRLTSEAQIMLRFSVLSRGQMFKDQLGLVSLQNKLANQAPHLCEHIPGLCKFALKMGSGDGDIGSVHIAWIAKQVERFIPPGRRIRGALFNEIAEAFPVTVPMIKRCLVFAMYTCPPSFVKERFCEWVTATDLRALARSEDFKQMSTQLEENLLHAQSRLDVMHLDQPFIFMARLETRTGRMLLKKWEKGVPQLDSFDAVWGELEAEVKVAKRIPRTPPGSPAPAPAPAQSSTPSSSSQRAPLLDAAGRCVDQGALFSQAGYQVGVYIKNKETGRFAVVEELCGNCIRLRYVKSNSFHEVQFQAFVDEYELVMDKQELQDRGALVNWRNHGLNQNDDFHASQLKARALTLLGSLSSYVSETSCFDITCYTKPISVFTTAHVTARSLILMPLTSRVIVTRSGEAPPKGGFLMTLDLGDDWVDSYNIYLMPQMVLPSGPKHGCVEPFFMVKRLESSSDREATMVLDKVTMSSAHVVTVGNQKAALKDTAIIPVLINATDLEPSVELTWVDPSLAPKKKKEPKPVIDSRVAKRNRGAA